MNSKETIPIYNSRTGKTDNVTLVVKTDAEWQVILTTEQYKVCLLYTSDAADE